MIVPIPDNSIGWIFHGGIFTVHGPKTIMLKKPFRAAVSVVKQYFYLNDFRKWHDIDSSRGLIVQDARKKFEMRGIVEYYGDTGDTYIYFHGRRSYGRKNIVFRAREGIHACPEERNQQLRG